MLARRISNVMLVSIAVLLLSSCTTMAAKELHHGKQEYMQQNYQLSYHHVNRAAKAGDADAQYALGYMYYYGKGISQNKEAAIYWMKRAAQQNQPEAIKALQMLRTTSKPKPHARRHPVLDTGSRSTHSVQNYNDGNSHYTIQMLGSTKKSDASAFIKYHKLGSQASTYLTHRNGKNWYVVIYGKYPTLRTATIALKKLPRNIKKEHPWVKSMTKVQAEMKK